MNEDILFFNDYLMCYGKKVYSESLEVYPETFQEGERWIK